MPPPDKLRPNDPRATHHCYTNPTGQTYHYLQCLPSTPGTEPRATALLLHGFPDFSYGWRYQIPHLTSPPYNLRLIIPDMQGYALSSSPTDLTPYTLKRSVDDLAALVKPLLSNNNNEKILVFGHDWGAILTYRFAMYHPELVLGFVTLCAAFSPPTPTYRPVSDLVTSGRLPNFGYQLQFASGEVERRLDPLGKDGIRQFLNALYGGSIKSSSSSSSSPPVYGWSASKGIDFENAPRLRQTPLLSTEELDFYVDSYAKNAAGLRGPLNWYRTGRLNWEDELDLLKERERQGKGKGDPWFHHPAMFIVATRDPALPPGMARGMDRHFTDLAKREAKGAHWILWERPGDVNRFLGEFTEKLLGSGKEEGKGKPKL